MLGTGCSEGPFYAFNIQPTADMGVLGDVDVVIVGDKIMVENLQIHNKGQHNQKQDDTYGRMSLKSSKMALHISVSKPPVRWFENFETFYARSAKLAKLVLLSRTKTVTNFNASLRKECFCKIIKRLHNEIFMPVIGKFLCLPKPGDTPGFKLHAIQPETAYPFVLHDYRDEADSEFVSKKLKVYGC